MYQVTWKTREVNFLRHHYMLNCLLFLAFSIIACLQRYGLKPNINWNPVSSFIASLAFWVLSLLHGKQICLECYLSANQDLIHMVPLFFISTHYYVHQRRNNNLYAYRLIWGKVELPCNEKNLAFLAILISDEIKIIDNIAALIGR